MKLFLDLLSTHCRLISKFQLPDQMRRSAEQSLRRRELRLARVSLLIVFIFLLCHTPKVLPSMFEIAIGDIHVSISTNFTGETDQIRQTLKIKKMREIML